MSATEFLAESKRVEEAATGGPWWAHKPIGSNGYVYVDAPGRSDHGDISLYAENAALDAEFIAHARTVLPRMREALEAVLALHTEKRIPISDSSLGDIRYLLGCSHDGYRFPCPTVRAIESALAENGGSDD